MLEVRIFFKKLVFIQQSFAKLIETVIEKIDIVRKHLYFELILFFFSFFYKYKKKKKKKKNKQHKRFQYG